MIGTYRGERPLILGVSALALAVQFYRVFISHNYHASWWGIVTPTILVLGSLRLSHLRARERERQAVS